MDATLSRKSSRGKKEAHYKLRICQQVYLRLQKSPTISDNKRRGDDEGNASDLKLQCEAAITATTKVNANTECGGIKNQTRPKTEEVLPQLKRRERYTTL